MNYYDSISTFSKAREEDTITMDVVRKGPWTSEEDSLLIKYVSIHGEGRWNSLARSAGLNRTGKSCRLRWLNYLRPDVRRGNITLQEQLLIIELHSQFGNRWSKIAQHIPGRTDNEIKNYWRTKVQKHAKHLKCDVNSKTFRDALRYIWMPRLMERVSQSSSTTTAPANNYTMIGNIEIGRRVVQGAREDFNSPPPLGSSSGPEISGSSSSGCNSEAQTHVSFDFRDFNDVGSQNYINFEEFQYGNIGFGHNHQGQGGLEHPISDDQNNGWIIEDSFFLQDQLLNDEDICFLGQQLCN